LTEDLMETIWQKAHLYDRSRSAAITLVFRIARNRRIDVRPRSRQCCVPTEDFFTIPEPAVACDEHLDAQATARICAQMRSAPCRRRSLRR
jgi:RNA polymerase sigma-70 factor (ECF subfamily)